MVRAAASVALFLVIALLAVLPAAAQDADRPAGDEAPPVRGEEASDAEEGGATEEPIAAEEPPPPEEGREATPEEPLDVVAEEPGDEPPPSSSSARTTTYVVERIEIRGNGRTDAGVIRAYLPMHEGDTLDVDDQRVDAVRWRLLGTGWFEEVRLTIERGTERGRIVLVVNVSERNTFTVEGIALGLSEGLLSSATPASEAHPYFGITLAELNFFGTGVGLQATALLSVLQQGGRIRLGQENVGGSDWGLHGSLQFNNARDFFGGSDDVLISRDECIPSMPDDCETAINAVVEYRRYGASIGTGTDIESAWRFTLDWHFEAVELVDRPEAASHRRGTEIVPIDFHVHDGWSFVSALELGVAYDTRDNPGLPTEGRYVFVDADLGTQLLGGSYDFVRVRAGWREWFRLPEAHHALRLGLFVGAAVGDAPFFYRFYVGDLSDLIPARVLEQNLDRRGPLNLFSTAIAEMRAEELAGRLDLEYSLWLYEGTGDVRGFVVYGLVGLYTLLDREDLSVAIPGYEGFSRVPIDLTFDVGVRLDTTVGVFTFGFSSLLGFIQVDL